MKLFIANKRGLALVICLVFLAGLLLSGLFVATHSHHRCTGTHCEVCQEIRQALADLARALCAAAALLPLLSLRLRADRAAPQSRTRVLTLSPVAAGDRLNN